MYTECIYMQMRLQPATHSGSLLSLVAPHSTAAPPSPHPLTLRRHRPIGSQLIEAAEAAVTLRTICTVTG